MPAASIGAKKTGSLDAHVVRWRQSPKLIPDGLFPSVCEKPMSDVAALASKFISYIE